MRYRDIVYSFLRFNGILDIFIETDPIIEGNKDLIQEYDKYIEEIINTIKIEISYELSEILRPYLEINRTEIVETYRKMNDKFRSYTRNLII